MKSLYKAWIDADTARLAVLSKRQKKTERANGSGSAPKYDFIDALRGWAIIGVIFVHTSHWYRPTWIWLYEIASQGARGVQLFFIASALTLFLSMEYRKKTELRPTLNFYLRRFFRIAPLFYIGIIFYLFVYGLGAHDWRPNGLEWWHVGLTATFLNSLHPETTLTIVPGGWSVADEFMFYFCAPFLFVLLKNVKSTLVALAATLFVMVLFNSGAEPILKARYSEDLHYLVDFFIFSNPLSQLPIFLFGILNFHIIKNRLLNEEQSELSKTWILIFALFLGSFALYLSGLAFVHIVFGPVFLAFSLFVYLRRSKFFVNRITREIGKLSFSMYLSHFAVIFAVKALVPEGFAGNENGSFVIGFMVVLLLTAAVSFLTYHLIEAPGVRLGRKVVERLEATEFRQSREVNTI